MQVINFDKGSKKELQRIRWTRAEIMSAVMLTLVMIASTLWMAFWYASHDSEPETPALEIRH